MKILDIIKLIQENESEKKRHAAWLFRMFYPSERYVVDSAEDRQQLGFEQFDTDQDAPYFGVWVSKTIKSVLTYCEGDWTLVVCETVDAYNAEVRECIDFYDEGRIARVISDNKVVDYRQDRNTFLIKGE